ncbi:MAG TPA: STAS domain-containing protein [Armatimonadota bacterium]|nr:STAS domain-containing protein [Armatimonadota bacterium]
MDADTRFDVEMQGDVPVVQIVGDLDHYSTPEFRSVTSELIQQGHKTIVVDMSAVDFMDSSGMSGIIFAAKRLAAADGHLSLTNCNPRTARKLSIGGLTKMPDLLSIYPSLEEALQHLLQPQGKPSAH